MKLLTKGPKESAEKESQTKGSYYSFFNMLEQAWPVGSAVIFYQINHLFAQAAGAYSKHFNFFSEKLALKRMLFTS